MAALFVSSFATAYKQLDQSLDKQELERVLQTHFAEAMQHLEVSYQSHLLIYKEAQGDNPTIAGFAIWSEEGDKLYLRQCAVSSQWWHKGVGSSLVTAGYAQTSPIMTASVTSVYLKTREFNVPAISLYKKLGFVEVGQEIVPESHIVYLILQKQLK